MNQELWKKAVDFHGHHCPGLAIGFRAAIEAIKALDIPFSEDEEIVCVTENDACGVDGIQVVLGCSVGKGNLLFRNRGKQAFSIFNRRTGKSIRLVLKNLPEMSREEKENYLLNEPDGHQIFDFKPVPYDLPEQAQIFNSIICESCGEKTAEPMIRLENGQKLCLDCSHPYSRGF
ncbi:MAG: FmdE family protein [Eubacteriaceae bacterium]